MGLYIDSGNSGFQTIRNDIYVDKSGLISYINGTIDTPRKLTCFSRPRRFGKSFAAKMLCAYYDRSCESDTLFADLAVAADPSYHTFLNHFPVIYLDITGFITRAEHASANVVDLIQQEILKELRLYFPGCIDDSLCYLPEALLAVCSKSGCKFIVIIDEWDALFRETSQDTALQQQYVQFLRSLFKNSQVTDRTIAAAYMTGILPIKKYGTQSALTDFREFSMVKPARLSDFIGFTEDEVQALCRQYHMDFSTMQQWYDGYSFFRTRHVYSPNSVMHALFDGEYRNYWTSSETYESLKKYIDTNMDGLRDSIISMLGGAPVQIDTATFQNDMTSMCTRDDILTLLVHLGYLAYDEETSSVCIPNLEVADAFKSAVQGGQWAIIHNALISSDQLLSATLHQDETAVACALDAIHSDTTSILQYNDENSLSCALTIAYYTARRDYRIIRELPAGKGFADLAFIPYDKTRYPAMIVELKYDQSADSAIRQIKDRRYTGPLAGLAENILLVGISYRKDDPGKHHVCRIETASLAAD